MIKYILYSALNLSKVNYIFFTCCCCLHWTSSDPADIIVNIVFHQQYQEGWSIILFCG